MTYNTDFFLWVGYTINLFGDYNQLKISMNQSVHWNINRVFEHVLEFHEEMVTFRAWDHETSHGCPADVILCCFCIWSLEKFQDVISGIQDLLVHVMYILPRL